MIETLEVIPDPVSLIESMRAVGYSAESAIADIVDNSLSAGAKTIQIKYDASFAPFVAVLDDGHGMAPDELTAAMRHGSGNPSDHRGSTDLGRFGLGLKTASLSQCRKLTVVSKKGGVISARCWDLDVVQERAKWLVVVPAELDLIGLPMYRQLASQDSGTLVVWQHLDRLTAGARDAAREMTTKMAPVLEHLALVFHRFISDPEAASTVTITVNSKPLPPRDPFLGGNQFRQVLEGQTVHHERGKVAVQPYVLPPVSNLTSDEVEFAGGREGLRGTQGFYLYRGRRLVIWGTWFGLVAKEEFFKLTRIRVDIPNSFDDLWALDIKKSAAHPPEPIRSRLRELIPHFANTSKRTVTYSGRATNASVKFIPSWLRIEHVSGSFRYEVNPEHPLIKAFANSIGDEQQRHLQMIFEFLGAAIPYQGIYADMCADRPRAKPEDEWAELIEMAETLRSVAGLSLDRVLEIDPFCRYPHLHSRFKEELDK